MTNYVIKFCENCGYDTNHSVIILKNRNNIYDMNEGEYSEISTKLYDECLECKWSGMLVKFEEYMSYDEN